MNAAPEVPRDEEMLGRLAEMDLALAQDVFNRARAASDAAEMANLTRCYQRLARSCRQSIGLLNKIRAEWRREARDHPPPPPQTLPQAPPETLTGAPRDRARIRKRSGELGEALERIVWHIAEEDHEREILLERVRQIARVDAAPAGWGLEPLDDQVMAFCAAWGWPEAAALNWRNLPPPPDGDAAREPEPADTT